MSDDTSKGADSVARAIPGSIRHDDGTRCSARFYYGADEPAPFDRERVDPARYTTWVEADGAIGIRRGTSVSVGATPQYAAKYDTIDWGN